MNNEYYPLISVIIPSYNRFELLKKSIVSVLNNTYKNVEIIVINDKSTDEKYYSGELEKYDKTIILHLDVNQKIKYNVTAAQGKTRQCGVNIAKGEWICFLDDDDMFYNNKLELQINVLKASNCKMCSTNMTKIKYINNELLNCGSYFNEDAFMPKQFNLFDIKRTNYINNSSVIIHKSILDKCGEFSLGKNEDYDMWLRALIYTNCAYIKEPLVYYCIENIKHYV